MFNDDSVLDKYHSQKMGDEIKNLIEGLRKQLEGDSHGEAVKSVPAKPEWIARQDEMQKMADEVRLLSKKIDSKSNMFWATVQEELNEYRDMHYNDDTNEIDIFDDKKKGRKR